MCFITFFSSLLSRAASRVHRETALIETRRMSTDIDKVSRLFVLRGDEQSKDVTSLYYFRTPKNILVIRFHFFFYRQWIVTALIR